MRGWRTWAGPGTRARCIGKNERAARSFAHTMIQIPEGVVTCLRQSSNRGFEYEKYDIADEKDSRPRRRLWSVGEI